MRLLAVALVLALSACGGPGPGAAASDSKTPALPEAPAAQRVILSDGVVTRAEYESAFASFTDCLKAEGGELEEQGREPSGVILYRVKHKLGTPWEPDLSTAEGRCYHETFDSVEYLFQTTDPAVLAAAKAEQDRLYAEKVRPCLARNGVTAPAEIDQSGEAFADLMRQWSDLDGAGKC